MHLWRNFPALYTLPFVLATTQFPAVVMVSELARWGVLLLGFLIAFRYKFRRGGFHNAIALRTDLFLVATLTVFLVSSFWSFAPGYTFQKTVSVFLLIATSFWAFWRYADRYSDKKLLDGILSMVIVVLAANVTIGWFLGDPMLNGRFRGFFINPNNIGILVSIAGGVVLVRWIRHMNWANSIALAIVATNLILAGSRTALLALALVLVLSLARTLLAKPLHGVLFITALIVGGLWFSQTEFFVQRILREDTLTDASNRVFFWALAKDYIANHWMLGHGFGTDIIIHDHYGVVLRDQGLRGAGVMSSYYGLAIQIGVPMAVLFFTVVWGYILFVIFTRVQDFWRFSYAAILAGGMIVAVFEPVLFSAGNAFSFVFLVVFMLLVRRETYRRRGVPLGEYGEILPTQAGLSPR